MLCFHNIIQKHQMCVDCDDYLLQVLRCVRRAERRLLRPPKQPATLRDEPFLLTSMETVTAIARCTWIRHPFKPVACASFLHLVTNHGFSHSCPWCDDIFAVSFLFGAVMNCSRFAVWGNASNVACCVIVDAFFLGENSKCITMKLQINNKQVAGIGNLNNRIHCF